MQVCGPNEICVAGRCKTVDDPGDGPGNDHPDDNFDVSTSKMILDAGSEPETAPEVAILFKGFPTSTANLLSGSNELSTFVDIDFSPDLASDYPILIIPSGGLYGLDSLSSFKSNLEQYVGDGGTLIVFSQQHGYEFNALPGGEVSGFGWLEDQACHHGSVGISTYHPLLSGQDSIASDVNVDGYFTSYPDNATILLTRTKNGMPAMLMYEYGEGRVIATTAYTDWAYGRGEATQDGKNLVRDVIAWVKDPQQTPGYGVNETVDIPLDVSNVRLPIPEIEYPQYELGDEVSISVDVTNYADDQSADKVVFSVFDPGYDMEDIDVPVSIAPGNTAKVDFIYETTASSTVGAYLVLYTLYAGETVLGGGFGGGFVLGVDTTNLSTYKVNFTLADPDKEIVNQENIPVYVPPGEIETVNFTYANPPKLGIWSLEYEVRDYSDTLIDSAVRRFAVSNYAENPGGFAYQGPDLRIWATTPDDQVPVGTEVPFAVYVRNDSDSDFSGNIAVGGHEARHEGGRWWAYYGAITDIAVPAHSEASYVYSHTMDLSAGMYFGLFEEGVPYEDRHFHEGAVATSEKGVWVFHPSVDLGVTTEKSLYTSGEDVSVSLNMKNERDTAYDVSAVVRVLDPENYKLFEDAFDVTLPGYASDERTFNLSLAADAKYGFYVVTAEARVEGEKVGSGSAYFEVRKGAIVRLSFDQPNKAYRARESMSLVLEAMNVVSVPWSSTVDISIPDLDFSDSVDFVLDPGQTEQISYNLSVPADIAVGKHDITVITSIDSSTEQYHFVVPESRLVLTIDRTSYSAGEDLSISLTNAGGVDTNGDCSIEFRDRYGLLIHESNSVESVLAGESTALTFTLPSQLVSDDYYLIASCKDLTSDRVAKLSKSIIVDGLEASLTQVTDKKAYFNDEDISIQTQITNLGGEIIDGMLNLKIVRPVDGIVETSLGSISQETQLTYSTPSIHTLSPTATATGSANSVARAYNFMPDRPVTETRSAPRNDLPRRYDNGPPIGRDAPSSIYQATSEHGSPNNYYPDYASPTYGGPPSEAWPAGYAGVTSLTYGSLPSEAQPTSYASVTSEGSGSISGFVYEEDGVTPIEGATVKAADWDAQPFQFVGESTTNASGAYVISELGTGDYRVIAYALEHAYELYLETHLWYEAQPVSVTDGQVIPDVDFSLGPGGTISGTITSADSGTPLSQVSVLALHADSGALGAIAFSDESGHYTITNLPYETYFVQSPSSWRHGSGDENYLAEFWQEKTDWGEADSVAVSDGVNPSGINFTLAVGGSISGVVRDEAGDPIAGASVYASEYDIWASGNSQTAEDGSYTIHALPSGNYRVYAWAPPDYILEYYDGVYDSTAATLVPVTVPNDTSGISFVLEVGGSISGVVKDEAGDPIAGAWVSASEYDSGAWGSSSQTAEDGSYTVTGLPSGNYRVQAQAPDYIREYYDDVYDWDAATPVPVTVPSNTPDIDFTLELGGTISGVVKNEAGDPIQGALVYASEYDSGDWGSSSWTAEDGNYTITGLPSGSYLVRVWATDYVPELYDNVYSWQQDLATPVSVTAPNDTPNINFTLGVGGTISGHVYQEDGVTPLPNVGIGAKDYDMDRWTVGANTAEDGSYSLRLPTGTYLVRAMASESGLRYVDEFYGNVYDQNSATPVSVIAPNDTPNIDFTLEPGGSISGHVYQEDGATPIPGLYLYAEDYDTGAWIEDTNTGEDGSYSLILPTGTYRVWACGFCNDLSYVSEWYDNTHSSEQATPVSVTVPDDTPGIDFTLEVGGTISGHVYQEDGVTPIRNVHVSAEDYDTGVGMAATDTNLEGSYTITGLPTGTYRVRVCPSCNDLAYVSKWYDNTHHGEQATPVSVSAPNDTPDVDFTLELGGTISGHIYQGDGVTPIPNVHVAANDYDTGVWMEGTNTGPDGSYSLVLPTGTYRVGACPTCNDFNYVNEYYDDTYYQHEATPVSVTAPNDTPNINFTLELGGSISGYVYQQDGVTPIPNVWVGADDYDTGVGMGGTDTGLDGSYTLVGLPTGTYRVGTCASCDGLHYIDELYDDVYHWEWAVATPVSVTAPNDTPNINFTLEVGGTISGHIYQEDGVTPLPNVHVYAEDYDTGIRMEGPNTNLDGSYTIVGLPTGTYRVGTCASCDGLHYIDELYDDVYHWEWAVATPVSVTAPNDTPNINFTLEVGGTISGHVYQEDGVTPLANVYVYADDYDTSVWMADTSTNLDGSYTMTGLPTGTYQVRACPSCNGLNYVSEWYDDSHYEDQATPVSVTAPSDTSDIDFTLEPGGTISGFVYQEDGVTPIPNACIGVADYDRWIWMEGTDTNLDGSYTISGLPTGTYRVRASGFCSGLNYVAEWYDNTYDGDQATPISVIAPNDTPDIDFTLEIGGTISGHVYKEDGVTPLPNVHVSAEDHDTGVWMESTNTSPDGRYSLVLPTGTYRVRACPSCNGLNYVSEFYDDTYYEPQATPVSVTAPSETPGIDFTLEVGGTISGHVYQEDGVTPLFNVRVSAEDYNTGEELANTDTDLDGSYTIVGLPTGTYRVRACASCSGLDYVDELYDDVYHWQWGLTTPVSVTSPNDTPNINFTLELGGTISGHVYQEDGVTPLANVYVYADDYDTSVWMADTSTNLDGSYTMTGLPTGTYQVRACPSCNGLNYVSEWYDDAYYENEATPVSVTAPSDTSDINFTLEPGGTISGYVYQEDGITPLPNACIGVADYDRWIWMEGTDTNPDGSYTMTGLPTGMYRARASGFCSGLNYVSKWYDNTHDGDQATPVFVVAPDDTPNINFTLELGGTISGHVYQEDGETPLPNVHIYAEDYDTGVWMEGTNTGPDGSYSLVLPTGTYRVGACPTCSGLHHAGLNYVREWFDGTYYQPQATSVSVTAPNDTPDINFTLEIGGTISGHVYQEDGVTPIRNVHVYAEDYNMGVWMEGTDTNPDGSYSLVLPTGTYRVRACPSCNGLNYFDEWYDSTRNWEEATPVSVTAPNDTAGINFTLVRPLLTLTPSSGSVGALVTVSGSGMTPSSTIPIGGITFAGIPWNEVAIPVDSAGNMAPITLAVPMVGIGPQQVVATDSDGMSAEAIFTVTAVVWETTIPVTLSVSEVKNIVTNISIPSGMPNMTGKFNLLATLYASSSQAIAQSDTYSFFITDTNTSLTLETDKQVYKPNEPITIYGEAQNNAEMADDFSLSIRKDTEEIFFDSFTLAPGESYSFTTSTTSESSFTLAGIVNGLTVMDSVRIEYPNVDVTILGPDVVGLAKFDVGILVENVADVNSDIRLSMADEAWDMIIAPGESRLVETAMSITQDTTLNAVVSGDVEKTAQKEIIMGEGARIDISPQELYLEGPLNIPFTVANTGIMDTEFEATFSVDGQGIVKAFYLPQGESIADALAVDLGKGEYRLEYGSPFEEGSVDIHVAAPELVVASAPDGMTLMLGQDVVMTFVVENRGGAEGEANLRLTIPGIFEQSKSVFVRPGEQEETSFDFRVPDDLEEKEYRATYELNGVEGEFSFRVQGLSISVAASLDKALYEEGEIAVLTLTVTNDSDLDLSLYARVQLNEFEELQHFGLTDSVSLEFDVPVSFNGQKLFYGIYAESGRALHLNSVYVHKKEAAITLYTDKQVYSTGETVTVFVDTTQSGTLNVVAPGYAAELPIDGSTALSFTVPELRSGTYYIDYTFNGFASSYPLDVIGYSARIIEFRLDREIYASGDTMELDANVEVNRDVDGLLRIWLYDPQDNLIDEFEIPRALIEGENKIETQRAFSTDRSGIHALVYGVYGDLPGSSLVLLASGAEYFDGTAEADTIPPTTMITPEPLTPDGLAGWYVSPVTVSLAADDNPGGSGVTLTEYRLDGDPWQTYAGPFTLLADGTTTVEARSTDNAGNVEDPPASVTLQIDQTAPMVTIEVPAADEAVQDGIALAVSASDATSGVADVRLYVREDTGGDGTPVGYEDLPAVYDPASGDWEYHFDSTQLPDGHYVILAKARDNAGNEDWSEVRHFSIRNWAVLELLPASKTNKAGRTMPVKFSLRIAAAVDPAQPFVRNEELTIKVFETGHADDVLQISMYGDTARDYRIDSDGELYITNFKTLKKPKDYTVEIWRKEFLVGSFTFSTVK